MAERDETQTEEEVRSDVKDETEGTEGAEVREDGTTTPGEPAEGTDETETETEDDTNVR